MYIQATCTANYSLLKCGLIRLRRWNLHADDVGAEPALKVILVGGVTGDFECAEQDLVVAIGDDCAVRERGADLDLVEASAVLFERNVSTRRTRESVVEREDSR